MWTKTETAWKINHNLGLQHQSRPLTIRFKETLGMKIEVRVIRLINQIQEASH
jgi:hypothetical protein